MLEILKLRLRVHMEKYCRHQVRLWLEVEYKFFIPSEYLNPIDPKNFNFKLKPSYNLALPDNTKAIVRSQ